MRKKLFFIIIFILFFYSDTVFGMILNLKSAIQIGLKNNRELKIASARLKEAKAELGVARSSFFPSIELKGNYSYLGVVPEAEMMSLGYVPMPTMTDPYRHTHTMEIFKMQMARQNNYDASVTVTQPIFMWGRLKNNYTIANIKLKIEEENYLSTKLKVIKEIKSAFYNYLIAKKNAELMEESFNQMSENVKSAEVNYKAGIITKYDFKSIKIQLDNMEPSLVISKNFVALSKKGLKNVLGIDKDDFEIESDIKYKRITYDYNKLEKEMLNGNPTLKILSYQKEIMDRVISLSRANNKPSLVGIFNYKYTYLPEDDTTFGSSEPNSWTVALSLSIPVSEWFPWSKTMNQIDKSKADYDTAKLNYEQVKDGLLINLQQTHLEIESQYDVIDTQNKNIENAEDTYQFRKKQYASGLIRYTELIDAQVALTKAKKNYLEAIFKYVMAKATLDELLGRENYEEF